VIALGVTKADTVTRKSRNHGPALAQRCGHPWCDSKCSVAPEQKIKHMKRARDFARSGIRPSTLAAEFSTPTRHVTKDAVVEAIAKALLPFIETMK